MLSEERAGAYLGTHRIAARKRTYDLNTAMLAVARAKSAAIEWIKGSALDLPFEANSFDVVLFTAASLLAWYLAAIQSLDTDHTS